LVYQNNISNSQCPVAIKSSGNSEGYVTYGAYFNKKIGHYTASAILTTDKQLNLEVWNSTTNQLIGRQLVGPTQIQQN
jgi:hypothetical protein